MQLQHHLPIFANELTYFIDHKQDVTVALAVEPLFHPCAEIFDIQREVLIQLLDPLARRLFTLACSNTQRLSHLIVYHQINITLIFPARASDVREGSFKGIKLSTLIELTLQVCNMREVPTITSQFVKDFQKDFEDGINAIFNIRT